MPIAIPVVLVVFIDKAKVQGKINCWYSSLKNDDGIPSFRIFLEIEDKNEETILSEFSDFLNQRKAQIGWNGKYYSQDPVVDPNHIHMHEINIACELVLKMAKKYPQLAISNDLNFWNELKYEIQVQLSFMEQSHQSEYIHFIANNLGMQDRQLLSKLCT
jgi:hypothetical protein